MKNLIWMTILGAVSIAAGQNNPTGTSVLGQTLTGAFGCNVSITSKLPPNFPTSFPGAISFFADGNVVAQGNGDGPAVIEHGVWLRTGDRTFRTTWIGFAQDNSLKYTGPFKVYYNFRLDSDLNTLNGAYRVDFYDPSGANKVFSFAGKAACTRVTVDDFDDQP